MYENLVIVESPAKAKTIEKFLGDNFHVVSSYGHIRDLSKKDFGIDIKNNFAPEYIVSEDKKNIVKDLKKFKKESKEIWLASDEDREGEAIAWHLAQVLELDEKTTKRIVFHEITKEAIQKAIKTPRTIDLNLVYAQQARRILDRLVGFEISPILWRKVKPSLSAGRVQSVAVRVLVEREREIIAFKSESSYRVIAQFKVLVDDKEYIFAAELSDKLPDFQSAKEFLDKCKTSDFKVVDVIQKPSKRAPSAPFITSTLQQEASRKLGFSVSQTMSVAQKLYEAGHITYMRTDSVNLSETIIEASKKAIIKDFGEKYLETRQYTTKAKGAQEAHEAIRPTYIDNKDISASAQEKKLYDLIWKRTIASQMKDASFEKTTAKINISNSKYEFVATGEVLKFDGFLKVYQESTDDDDDQPKDTNKLLPPIKTNDVLNPIEITATERFSHHPARYTEASLVRKLEELGIGRPSTYAPTITTILNRGYVVKEDRIGEERVYNVLSLKNKNITEKSAKEITGAEKSKLFPSDIGMLVNDFLVKYFDTIVNFNFTAEVEKEFDDIASGKLEWATMIDKFYNPFHVKVEDTLKNSERSNGVRVLGKDPKTGFTISVRIGRFGPMAQIGEADEVEKPKFASLQKGQYLEQITLEEALSLFDLPRIVGEYEGKEMTVAIGRFGPYIKVGSMFVSLKKEDDPYTITLNRAIELYTLKQEADKNKTIKTFSEDETVKVLNGRWGPYIAKGKNNYKIPKSVKPEELTFKQCKEIIESTKEKKK